MRKLIKNIFWAGLIVVLTAQFAQAFSLIGPAVGGGTAGDAWEQPVIGHGLPGDVGTVKNLGEEYRRVTPVMYYASDATFIGFFGTAGLTNIDSAFAIMNGTLCGQTNTPLFLSTPTNGILAYGISDPYTGVPFSLTSSNTLDYYTKDLADFPLESQQLNYTAQALGLLDLRSSTLELLVEQLGLAEPERFAWTLHDRYLPPGGKCPGDELYLVVQRNLDIIDSPLNQVQYSPYVNGTLYTYDILEACTGPNPLAETFPVAVDIFADTYTAVASFNLFLGGFYNNLTRDDVAGLRYLMTTNNINFEATAPSGSLLLQTNVQAPQLFTTAPIGLLFSQSVTNDPNTLLTLYPGLTYLSVTTNYLNQITTNIFAYFTNLAGPYTNHVPISNGVAIYPTNGTVPFTNWSPIQYGDPPILLTTLPLTPLLYFAQFIDPVTLESLYPGLLVGNVVTNFLAVQLTTNLVPYFTNQTVLPVFSTSVPGGITNNGFYFTNQPGPTTINFDTTSFNQIQTLDLANFADAIVTNGPAVLQALYPGLQILRYQAYPGVIYVTNYVSYLTNYTKSPYGSPAIAVTLPVSTNQYFGTNYVYTFGNIFTNHFYTNRLVRTQNIWTTNQISAPYGSPLITVTNYTMKTNHLVSGDFFIYPTNWCGFEVVGLINPNVNPPFATGITNTVIFQGYNSTNGNPSGTNNVVGGNSYGLIRNTFDIYTNYLIAVRPGICEPLVYWGTNLATNIISQYQYSFLNVVTNHYYSNSLVSLFITNIYYIPGGSPDLLGTNIYQTNFFTNFPSGDFYIVPTNWCGYQIVALLTNLIAPTNIVITNSSFGSGTVTTAQYTVIEYLTYTNYTYSIRPGFCEPALTFVTNFSTNPVTQYGYYFGNVITNHYVTNSPITTVITNDAIWTNGLVGWITNIVTTNFNYGISGDFYIIPPADCNFTILTNMISAVVSTTNTFTATNLSGVNLGQQYVQTTVSSYTNTTFLVQASTCATVAAPPALRQGIGRVEFIRANYDSLLGQFFQPLTNNYTMVEITNSQPVTEYYQRVITQPDFLIRARDLTAGPSGIPAIGGVGRNLNFDQSQILTGLAGPGTIIPGTSFTYNKVGNVYANGSLNFFLLTTNGFLNEYTGGNFFGTSNRLSAIAWASFDGSTNDPVVYPNGTSIANVVNQLFMRVTPSTVPDGTVGAAYTPVTFTATGGQLPYTWAAPNLSGLVPGMSFDASTATLSGTPTATGTFTFTVQLTDAVNRTVSLNYSITIH